jgi:hypothetical protein
MGGWDGRGDGVVDGSVARLAVGLGCDDASAGELEAGTAEATRAGDAADAIDAGIAVEVGVAPGAVPVAALESTGGSDDAAEQAPNRIAVRMTARRDMDPAGRAGDAYRRLTWRPPWRTIAMDSAGSIAAAPRRLEGRGALQSTPWD